MAKLFKSALYLLKVKRKALLRPEPGIRLKNGTGNPP